MSLRFRKGYWTIFDGRRPIMSFGNIWDAIEARDELP